MKRIGLIILAAALAVLCFFADRHLLSNDSASALYKRKSIHDNYDYYSSYDSGSFSYADAEGMTGEESTACDFRNLVDMVEYLSQFGGEIPMRDGKYIVSHNEFYMADGQLRTVDIASGTLRGDDSSGGQPPLYKGMPIFEGSMYMYMGGSMPCAYDSSGYGHALSYTYNGFFSLLLDDYNGDGNPDFVYRTCDPGGSGSYYYMQCMTPELRSNSQKLPSPHRNADSSFYVHGENAPSIRLNRIDRETVFYLTKNENEIYPVILDSDLRSVSDRFSVDGKLYSSFYEDGVLSLKCTCLDMPWGFSTQEEAAGLSLRKLTDRMWEKTDCPEETSFKLRSYSSDQVKLKIPLEKGVYRMEIYPEGGGIAVTEFTVR